MSSNTMCANRWNLIKSWLAFLVIASALVACGGGDGGVESGDASKDTDLVLDQEADAASCRYDNVFVTVEKIRLRQPKAFGEEARWSEISLSPARRIDLLAPGTGNGLLQELGAAPLLAGHYTDVRLVLASNNADDGNSLANAVQPTGGVLTALGTSSATQDGLKLQGDFRVPAGELADLVLSRSDACKSVVSGGKSGKYQLKPRVIAQAQAVTLASYEERRVNSTQVGDQSFPTVAKLKDGGYVIVWASRTSPEALYAQRYATDGRLVGTETRLTSAGTLNAVIGLADGGYLLTWRGNLLVPFDRFTNDYPVYARRFAADGTPAGAERQVYTLTFDRASVDGTVRFPKPTVLADGGYVFVWWQRDGTNFAWNIYSQRYAADDTAVGPAQLVNSLVPGARYRHPNVAGLKDGGYVITWSRIAANGPRSGSRTLFARRYAPDGTAVGPEQEVGTAVTEGGDIDALADGGYVITWANANSGTHISAQRYAADGATVGAEVNVANVPNESSTVAETFTSSLPSVAGLADGGYVVIWLGDGGVLYARRQGADGSWLGDATRIASKGQATFPDVTAASYGGFVVTWMAQAEDSANYVAYSRQFDANSLRNGAP